MAMTNGTAVKNGVGGMMAKKALVSKDRTVSSPALAAGRINAKKPLVRIPSITEGVTNGPRSVLYAGDELSGKENFLRSPNGRYEAVFTSEGPVEVYLTDGKPAGDRSVIIHSRRLRGGRQNETPLTWKLNDQGHLVATCTDGSVYFSTAAFGENQPPSTQPGIKRLEMRNDGNVILYHGDTQIWKTTTSEKSDWSIQCLYTYGAKVPGLGLLKQGSTMYNGDYLAKLENDGRLCVYQFEHDLNGIWKCEKCVWSTPTEIHSTIRPFRLIVQPDGDVVVKDGQNMIVWRTRTNGKVRKQPASFQLNDRGRLELLDGDGRAIWVSGEPTTEPPPKDHSPAARPKQNG